MLLSKELSAILVTMENSKPSLLSEMQHKWMGLIVYFYFSICNTLRRVMMD